MGTSEVRTPPQRGGCPLGVVFDLPKSPPKIVPGIKPKIFFVKEEGAQGLANSPPTPPPMGRNGRYIVDFFLAAAGGRGGHRDTALPTANNQIKNCTSLGN